MMAKRIIAIFISLLEIDPLCTVLAGPNLCSLSVPTTASPKSFARFESICKNVVVIAANIQTQRFQTPVNTAKPLPTIMLESARGRVRKRKACIQCFTLAIFSA